MASGCAPFCAPRFSPRFVLGFWVFFSVVRDGDARFAAGAGDPALLRSATSIPRSGGDFHETF
jgi:hypothetical protein